MADGAIDVRLENVSKSFDRVQAVREVSIDIPRGEFFSMLGPSGCGKTTTLRIIAGFERPSQGEVYIRGVRVTAVPPYRRDYSMVFQSFALFPHLTVAENVAFGLRMRRVPGAERRRRAQEALDMVKLEELAQRYPRQLSGGQQQRVALARALVVQPAVLLLDEPLGALDKKLREEMQVELRQLQRRLGTTTVFVTHDQEEALTMSDRIAIMRDGVIEQMGPPREVYERPRTEFVASFLGASNFFDARVIERRGAEAAVDLGFGRGVIAHVDAPGTDLRIAVRPEKIMLAPLGAPGTHDARIREIVYRGVTTHIYLDCAGREVIVFLQNTAPQALAWRIGDAVSFAWEAGNAVVLDRV
ncbi:MAG: ABC transporter ATP-binding protein [Alphaproteobacteria bacterium]|nr:ABC transporter ATP-binding protein [Alphaproteobacteria bacterium]